MKELEDYRWFPSVLRNFQTEFIGFVVSRLHVYDAFVQHIQRLSLPHQPMIDLGSGSGEPAISIFNKSNCFSRLTLTDKYPNPLQLHDDKISYEKQSMDVIQIEFNPQNYYTMFNALHHFSDDDKLRIVQQIHSSGSAAFLVEILEPRFTCMLKVLFTATIGSLLLTPFIQPFSFKRLFFTYVVPVNIITITFDGIVSVLKSRSARQYQELFQKYENTVKISRIKNGLSPLTVIHIQPRP